MRPRIAIPLPHSTDLEYSERAMPQYEHAIALAGGEPVRILLSQELSQTSSVMERCHAVLLPGSNADVDPAKFAATPSTHTAAADIKRDAVDALLLEHAYRKGKPVLGICYGLQSLNVFRGGSLVQHIPDALPENLRGIVNHEAGKTVAIAHEVEIDRHSRLAEIIGQSGNLPVNSSHHQAADGIGKGLRVVARCAEDGIIEAIEGTDRDRFLLALQWHPERSVQVDRASDAIFESFVKAARERVL